MNAVDGARWVGLSGARVSAPAHWDTPLALGEQQKVGGIGGAHAGIAIHTSPDETPHVK